jgi:hypothetical protein
MLALMCGRVRLSSDVSEIKLVFSIPPHRPTPNFPPSWNAAPTDPLAVRCLPSDPAALIYGNSASVPFLRRRYRKAERDPTGRILA